jgi:hypothetical protein
MGEPVKFLWEVSGDFVLIKYHPMFITTLAPRNPRQKVRGK